MSVDPFNLRRRNARLVVGQLERVGALSRAELAARTGLSAPTVGKVAEELIAAGLVEEQDAAVGRGNEAGGDEAADRRGNGTGGAREDSVGGAEGANAYGVGEARGNGHGGGGGHAGRRRGLGRPGRPLRLAWSTPRLIALQLGVRHTRLSALPVAGPGDESWEVDFATPRRAATWQGRLAAAAEQLPLREPWGVMVSVPGVVDESAGRVLLSPNLHWTEEAELAALVRGVWEAPVLLVQEIRALALGHLQAEPEGRNFLLCDFGDGVGAALVRDGRLYEGPLPLSGELGHTVIGGNDRRCGCGAVGCVETLVSRPGLLRSFAEATGAGGRSRRRPVRWASLVRHVEVHGVEPWLREALAAVGRVIGGAMNVAGVRQAVITGALTELPEPVMTTLAESVRGSAMWARFGEVEVVPAPRRRAAGLIAAAIDRLLLPLTTSEREGGAR